MNMPAPNDPELDTLLGAYALDALEPGERARVDAYLATNARARDEVDELRESAASLALAPVDDAIAPPELWDRITSTIDAEDASDGSAGGGGDDELAPRRMRRGMNGMNRARWLSLVAAAAAVVALVLATQVVSLHHKLDNARLTGEQAAAAAFDRAGHAPGARQIALMPTSGAEVARLVLLPDGSGYLKNDGLAPLDADHTYQLWALTGTTAKPVAISAGVLGSHPKAAAFTTGTDVHGFAITVEKSPGVGQSSQIPAASATLN
jgi:anti-sigma-K factor RskA